MSNSGNEHQDRAPRRRFRHTSASGGSQDQGERKDSTFESRQGGRQSQPHGQGDQDRAGGDAGRPSPPQGTNTQGDLAGIGEAADASLERYRRQHPDDSGGGIAED
jgi:hypothetical protein